ncbi:MAG TPA: bifunctional adenosylcobinamide kinase/adenosylcobinamide-phosphate guanylyltransferase [Clostridia bacterium]|nr:bifunctional adenosylcobinamide kinase/adenosylcobinamide-phosphate guanylyltransferase [Clostridia bacterium]
MLILVTGGAASGKSAFAESLVGKRGVGPRVYVACMLVRDGEDALRVARHRALRKSKGFATLEAPTALYGVDFPQNGAALIEDIANLAANECFSTDSGFDGAAERILAGIEKAVGACALTVAVTCEVACDGVIYDEWTARYIALLAAVNAALARKADEAYEVVCGIPIPLKGGRA